MRKITSSLLQERPLKSNTRDPRFHVGNQGDLRKYRRGTFFSHSLQRLANLWNLCLIIGCRCCPSDDCEHAPIFRLCAI